MRFLRVLVFSALVAGLISSVTGLILHSDIGRVFYVCSLSFGLGAYFLGKWLLGQRKTVEDPLTFSSFTDVLCNGILWLIGFVVSLVPSMFHLYAISIAMFIGMIAGSLIWPAENQVPSDCPKADMSLGCPDEDAARASNPRLIDEFGGGRHG